jgi:PKD repeat protein
LKGKKGNMDVNELFRVKLEYSELDPGESVRSELMHKLGRKEFLRFNPSRFNVFYLGGIAAATLTAILLLTPGQGTIKTKDHPSQQEKIIQNETLSINPQNLRATSGTGAESTAEKGKSISSKTFDDSRKNPEKRMETGRKVASEANRIPFSGSDSLKKNTAIRDIVTNNHEVIALQHKTLASFDMSTSSGCSPFKVIFVNRSETYDSCKWTFGDGGYSTDKNPVWIYDRDGEYKVILKVFGPGKSEASEYSVIVVHPRPVARFEIGPEGAVIPDDEVRFFNYSENAVRFRWEFGDGKISDIYEPVHKYSKYGNYNVRLIAWSEYGCPDSLLIRNAFSGSGSKIEFPNAFIPNPDGPAGGYYTAKSDEGAQIFHPSSTGVSGYQLRIFSKNGILIFESNDINVGWDGYHKGQICETGVYIWKVRGTFKNGEPFVKMGDVTLLRK